ncbi:MAG: hypothetical protein M0022_07230 [Desulfobacteraceae bacterium]|nr:hypothetical protein [Desulfobacteraceae bacterium]
MPLIDKLFSDLAGGLKGIFADNQPWTALDNLKHYIRQVIAPNIEGVFQPGIPLVSPVILLPEGYMAEGFEIVCNDGTKGMIEVWIQGERVPQASLICAGVVFTNDQIQIGSGVIMEPGAMVKGPAIIGDDTEVRQGAYVRGDCLVGKGCVIGHATEVKHSILMDGAKAGHFAYIGDSILGRDVNLGAGAKLANLRFVHGNVTIEMEDGPVDTGRHKLGAILGDNVQTGCNSVTNPGAIIGKGSFVAPLATVRPGFYRPHSVIR